MKVMESILVDCSPEEAFAFFDDRANDGRWMAAIIESEWVQPGASTRLGRRGRLVMDAMGRREFDDVVTGYEEGRLVQHHAVSKQMAMTTSCRVEPHGKLSRVTVTYEPERLPGGFFGRLMAPLTTAIVRRNFRADLRRLKEILESPSAPGK